MALPRHRLRKKMTEVLGVLHENGPPSRQKLTAAASELLAWKAAETIESLWPDPLTMVTATLDDGWGHGLEVIHLYARAAGIRIFPLGVLQSPEAVIQACRERRPDFLGLTVLQLSSDESLQRISRGIPAGTRIVAGGPVFRADPDFAVRTGVDQVAQNAAGFLAFLLSLHPETGA